METALTVIFNIVFVLAGAYVSATVSYLVALFQLNDPARAVTWAIIAAGGWVAFAVAVIVIRV